MRQKKTRKENEIVKEQALYTEEEKKNTETKIYMSTHYLSFFSGTC